MPITSSSALYYIFGALFGIVAFLFVKRCLRFTACYFSTKRLHLNSRFGSVSARVITTFEFRDPEFLALNGLIRFDRRVVNRVIPSDSDSDNSSQSETASVSSND